jgi:hypothetical protein
MTVNVKTNIRKLFLEFYPAKLMVLSKEKVRNGDYLKDFVFVCFPRGANSPKNKCLFLASSHVFF